MKYEVVATIYLERKAYIRELKGLEVAVFRGRASRYYDSILANLVPRWTREWLKLKEEKDKEEMVDRKLKTY
jgi:hypothetical protein